jgi:single-strand DNA-binding protein
MNVVVLRGTVSSEPRQRELPSGSSVTQIEITTRSAEVTTSVPVAVHDRPVSCAPGDEVVIVGTVQRRFFRAGGITQSRTEVIAARIVPARRRRDVERTIAHAAELLAATPPPPAGT